MLRILLMSVLANNILLICHVELEHNIKSQNPVHNNGVASSAVYILE